MEQIEIELLKNCKYINLGWVHGLIPYHRTQFCILHKVSHEHNFVCSDGIMQVVLQQKLHPIHLCSERLWATMVLHCRCNLSQRVAVHFRWCPDLFHLHIILDKKKSPQLWFGYIGCAYKDLGWFFTLITRTGIIHNSWSIHVLCLTGLCLDHHTTHWATAYLAHNPTFLSPCSIQVSRKAQIYKTFISYVYMDSLLFLKREASSLPEGTCHSISGKVLYSVQDHGRHCAGTS